MGSDLIGAENSDLTPLRVLIIGCGNIAGGFDEGSTSVNFTYTHAGAYAQDGRFNITACVEPDDNRRGEFMAAWSVPDGFHSTDELLDFCREKNQQFDVISICSPTDCHAHDFEIALCLKPKLIFCEKPVTTSLSETERLIEECRKANILLAVNYTRRWDPDILKLQADISAGQWGELRSVVGIYNKGILNNGSHMLDLCQLLIGPVKIIKVGKPVKDYFSDDPTIPVWLEGNQSVPIHLSCANAEDYAVFELQLIFSLGVLTMEEGGMFWSERRVIDNDTFKGYRKLSETVRRPGEYPSAMLRAVDNIYRAINQNVPIASNGVTSLAAQRVCEEVKQQVCTL